MNSTSFKLLKSLFIADMILLVLSFVFFDSTVVWNAQIGFISSSLVMIASFLSYRRMVNTRVEHNIITIDDSKDVIDKLEDPHDLYSEEVIEEKENDLVATVKEEKRRLKENKRSLFETLKDTKAALSVYRLGAYIVLILGFLYLQRHEMLYIPAYIVALGIPPIIIVIVLLQEKEKEVHS